MPNEEQTTTEVEDKEKENIELEQGSDTQAEGSEQSAESEQNAESEQAPAELQDSEPLGTQALEEQIEALKQELLDTKDQALRTVADAQNVKRRAEKEVTNARKFALEKFASELLGVVDNLERTVEAVDKDNEALKQLVEGVELTQKSLMDTLVKHKITPLDPLGEPFDPQFHQAMSMVENPDVEPNTVTLVMQKGYSLHGRLLRPAMVMVSKAPAGSVDEKA